MQTNHDEKNIDSGRQLSPERFIDSGKRFDVDIPKDVIVTQDNTELLQATQKMQETLEEHLELQRTLTSDISDIKRHTGCLYSIAILGIVLAVGAVLIYLINA